MKNAYTMRFARFFQKQTEQITSITPTQICPKNASVSRTNPRGCICRAKLATLFFSRGDGIACLTVLRIVLTEDESYVETDFDSDDYDYFMNYNCGRFWFEDFGIMVFSTKEKAEKALAKMKAEEQNNKCCISQHGDVQYCEYYGAWRCLNPDCKIPVLTSTLVGAHPNGCPYCDKWNSKKAEGEKDNAEIH